MKLSITIVLILINVAMFFIEPKAGGFNIDTTHPLNQLLQFTPAFAFEMPWTFVTSTFLHGDLAHLFFNMFGLFMFGIFLESRVKLGTFIFLYFLAGIVGNFGYYFTASDPFQPGVGASGALYGILGFLGVIAPRVPMYVALLPIPVPMFVAVIIYALIEFLGFFAPSNIARGAHLAGLAVGLLYGFWMRYQHREKQNTFRIIYTNE
jgi:membrane associated rhomboid family serine protease